MGAMGDCQSKYSDDGKLFVCARGAGHLGPHQCYPWSWHEEGAMKPTVPPADSALDRASIPAMNITNAAPPICTKHHETMVLSFYDRPGSPPGNGYSCRSCTQERLASPPEPKMQRALAEGEFNVVGDELRKSNDRLSAIEARLADLKIIEPAVVRMEANWTRIEDRLYCIEKSVDSAVQSQQRIEAQLTELRAEADKGREALDDERKALMNIALRIEKRLTAAEYAILEQQLVHFTIIERVLAKAAARKKKQERKRGRK